MNITQTDQDRITAAVQAAEAATTGEIYCVIAPAVSDYRETPLAWATGAAFLLPAAALLAGLHPERLSRLFGAWSVAHSAAADAAATTALWSYCAVQAACFVTVALVVSIPRLRLALTPRGLKADRVHKAAVEQFLGRGVHLTRERTGVLIFAALAERRAEVVADDGVFNAATQQEWDAVADLLTAGMKRGDPGGGFSDAVARAGAILAAFAPAKPGDNPNELPDQLVVLPRPGRL